MTLTLFNLITDGGPVDLDSQREVWEGLKHTQFIGYKGDGEDTGRSSKVPSRLSPERSKSELKYSPRTPVLQRSHSTPMSDRSEPGTRSRSGSETLKTYRPLQGQLSQIEGETQVIREQTEVSHFTDKEKSELSKLSEKADLGDLKSELTLPADIAEEETLEVHVEEKIHEEPAEEKVEEEVVEVTKSPEVKDEVEEVIVNEDQVDEGAEPVAKSPSEIKSMEEEDKLEPEDGVQGEEVVVKMPQILGDSVEEVEEAEKSREVTPVEQDQSSQTPSKQGSVVEDHAQGISSKHW